MAADLSSGVFDLPDLWRPSLLTVSEAESSLLFPDFELDVHAIRLQNPYATKATFDGDLRLPSLETFTYGLEKTLATSEGSIISTDAGDVKEDIDDTEDLWVSLGDIEDVESHHFSWERFSDKQDRCLPWALSECGPLALNAAVEQAIKHSSTSLRQGPIVKSDITLKALFDLALGRSSVLYSWDERSKIFRSNYQDMTTTGSTSTSFASVSKVMADSGSSIMRLAKFVEKTYSSGDIASKIAFANAISTIISAVETFFASQLPVLRSLLQLQDLIVKPTSLLQDLLALAIELRKTKTDEQVSSQLFVWCQKVAHESSWLSFVGQKILSRVSMPLMERIACWVGLTHSTTMAHLSLQRISLITTASSEEGDDCEVKHSLRMSELPAFLSPALGAVITETGTSLRILQRHHPDHVLVQSAAQTSYCPLTWQQSWPDIDDLLARARQYETNLSNAVRTYQGKQHQRSYTSTNQVQIDAETQSKPEETNEDFFEQTIKIFSKEPMTSPRESDDLASLVEAQLQSAELYMNEPNPLATPSIDMSSDLSFGPLLYAQARLVRGACMRTLFRYHDLREHLRLQRSFHLMGDGVFVARLFSALFDSDATTTERELGVMRPGHGMGLKVGSRSTWPPASSELRLALMGILSECYDAANSNSFHKQDREIPGGLSFAIRNLAEDEVARVLQPKSLYALDFLRLQYQPTSPIDAVITSSALEKYDLIFKFLLRLIRLLFVVSRLPRHGKHSSTLLFCNQARQFVNATAQHFFNTAICETWTAFDQHLDTLVSSLDDEDALNPPMMREIGGIEDLRHRHDGCLNSMLFGLLLRHRQQKIMAVLEDIYGYVLMLDSLVHAPRSKTQGLTKLHADFTAKVVVFLDVCRGLSVKRGYGDDAGQVNTMDRLVAVVDFNGYYASRPR